MAGVLLDGVAELKPLTILGVTGSIGKQTLDVARALRTEVAGIAAYRGSNQLLAIARELPAARVVVVAPSESEREQYLAALGSRVGFGQDELLALAAVPERIVINGVVGAAGLAPTVAGLRAGNRVALANKESLVAGGPVVVAAAASGEGEIIPVDSEHSALWQCLVGEQAAAVRRLILTASGGPFRGRTKDELRAVSVQDALAHPTWNMGPRITIDSATLMNKAFEVIEAHYLYAIPYDRIDVVVHPQSVVHSLVEFVDGTLKAELGDPDMRVPIQYAITYPERHQGPLDTFDLVGTTLDFEAPDRDVFPCLELGYWAGRTGRSAPAVLNAADEVAVAAFLAERIPFAAIADVVASTLNRVPVVDLSSVADVLAVDGEARKVAAEYVEVTERAG
ncbi:MAG: 1-deoxy-D-xylulose-5-phosphate reductoisomerase [Acidimicrobiia bacterium]|nr:1-deoxy-D-xylulose-5-phosphate reductoisomerase [Acidimicrobiia bacterium]